MKNKKGFTLTEVLVALSILMVIIFTFTPFMLMSMKNLQVASTQDKNIYEEKITIEEGIADGVTPNESTSLVKNTYRQRSKGLSEIGRAHV